MEENSLWCYPGVHLYILKKITNNHNEDSLFLTGIETCTFKKRTPNLMR
jgi:hypothetical protein